jgi:putative protease
LPYELVVDDTPLALGDRRYLLSPQDLAGIELLPELIRAGVASLKIEGRLKAPEYVASITRVYRDAMDRVWQSVATGATAEPSGLANELRQSAGYELEMAFSRGLYTGWLKGVNNQALVHGRFGKKRGVYLGQVLRVARPRIFVALEGPLKPGDGVVFDRGRPDQTEEGGRVYSVEMNQPARKGLEAALSFRQGAIDFNRIKPGDRLWKTDDPELNRRLRSSYQHATPRHQRPISARVEGTLGEPLSLVLRSGTRTGTKCRCYPK